MRLGSITLPNNLFVAPRAGVTDRPFRRLCKQLGAGYASTQWAFFGLGAIAGPLCAAYCATRWGWWGTTTGAYVTKAVAIALPLLFAGFGAHAVSGFLVGALSPGMAAITSGYLMQLIGPGQHKSAAASAGDHGIAGQPSSSDRR